MTLSQSTPKDSSQTEEKLKQLRDGLAEANVRIQAKQVGMSIVAMADCLFNRAPVQFLQRSNITKLREVTQEVTEQFNNFLRDTAPFSVTVSQPAAEAERAHYTVLTALIGDRPFVVDSLLEVLRLNDVRFEVLLHPILKNEGATNRPELVSLVYLEVERVEDIEKLQGLKSQFESTLTDLILVTDDFSKMQSRLQELGGELSRGDHSSKSAADLSEIAELASWLEDGGFVFIGSAEWKFGTRGEALPVEGNSLGLFRSSKSKYQQQLLELAVDALAVKDQGQLFKFSKSLGISPVHRIAHMDVICFERKSTNTVTMFVGLLTSRALSQEASSVPYIRKKLERLLALEEVLPNSYDYKEIVSIVDTMPKYELFSSSLDGLRREINLVLSIQQKSHSRICAYKDPFQRFLLFMIVMPRERFASGLRARIQNFLEDFFTIPVGLTEYKMAVSTDPLARIYYTLPVPGLISRQIDEAELEKKAVELTLNWDDDVLAAFSNANDRARGRRFKQFYAKAFPAQYKAVASPAEALRDVDVLEKLTDEDSVEFALHDSHLKIYKRGGGLTLSSILPLLENSGLEILNESAASLMVANTIWATIYAFEVRSLSGNVIDQRIAREVFLPGIKQVVIGKADNDRLNALLIEPGVSLAEITILRVLQRYLWQIKAFTTSTAIVNAIVRNPAVSMLIIQFFQTKFDPDAFASTVDSPTLPTAERLSALDLLKGRFIAELKNVAELDDDRVLRALWNVVDSTVRTNYFRPDSDQRVGIKIDCKKITQMPAPRPYFEIFISAPDFEGVHLRGGKVARGGLRWSERPDDYRTEVLGLVKTQMVKNSIIVPVGAKGGFVVRGVISPESVKTCYQRYITTLLEMTDNRSATGVINPPRVMRYDEDDPYLVVAADKGTASFSDIANKIAVEKFDFWLSDAFASGGSAGYSHKDLAITARGAWEATCQHFRELGIDVETQTFTTVGIGDMSGDVFGNGLVLSKNFKLLAAFDHRHVFLDPDPDPLQSFAERERLFNLARSSWEDYDRSKISKGGGVFSRREKEISLSPETQTALGLNQSEISGQELIQAILRAPVDLLWNGGIGTYVKSSSETHLQVGDRANDDVRIDATELRAKVVGEGGNLGFTQLARIEYSKLGGRCNTDAVDNSAGVDLSDHEVNLKILLQEPLKRGEITEQERLEILRANAEEVCRMVVHRNRQQAKIISLGVYRSRRNLDYYKGLIRSLESKGALDRKVEFLPDDEQLTKRSSLKAGLTRPELAILMAYMKMQLFETIIKSNLPEQPFLQRYLVSYFPKSIVDRFPQYAQSHPLKREIIATQVANLMVEHMGATFVYRTAEETGAGIGDIITAFLAADSILVADDIVRDLEVMNKAHQTQPHQRALLSVARSLDSMTRWILEHRTDALTWHELVARFKEPFHVLIKKTESFLSEIELSRFQESRKKLVESGFSHEHASMVAALVYSASFLDIVEISRHQGEEVVEVAKLYDALASEFQLTHLLEKIVGIEVSDRWEALAVRTMTAQLRGSVGQMTRRVISELGAPTLDSMGQYLESRSEMVTRFRLSLREFQHKNLTIPALMVITNQLTALSRGAK